jgi:predicted DNA binding CopG/RHH family protein
MEQSIKELATLPPETEEEASWKVHDATDYLDWTQSEEIPPDLTPPTTTISLHLADSQLDALKQAAHIHKMPYQSLIRMWIQEKLKEQ